MRNYLCKIKAQTAVLVSWRRFAKQNDLWYQLQITRLYSGSTERELLPKLRNPSFNHTTSYLSTVQMFVFTNPRNDKFPLSQIFQVLQSLTTNRITIISYTCSRVFHPFCIFSLLVWDSDAVFSFRPLSYSTITTKHRSLHTSPSLTRYLRQVSGFAFRSSSYTDKVYSWYL